MNSQTPEVGELEKLVITPLLKGLLPQLSPSLIELARAFLIDNTLAWHNQLLTKAVEDERAKVLKYSRTIVSLLEGFDLAYVQRQLEPDKYLENKRPISLRSLTKGEE